jgi:hypothetical protein
MMQAEALVRRYPVFAESVRTAISLPEFASHSLTERSCDETVTTDKPLGLNAALLTLPACPRRMIRSAPSLTPQIRAARESGKNGVDRAQPAAEERAAAGPVCTCALERQGARKKQGPHARDSRGTNAFN